MTICRYQWMQESHNFSEAADKILHKYFLCPESSYLAENQIGIQDNQYIAIKDDCFGEADKISHKK